MSGFESDRKKLDREFEKALEEVHPEELRSYMRRELSSASLTPALLHLLSARTTGREPEVREAAGVQFVHAGLEATRRILDDDTAWRDAGFKPVEEDMILLAANVLVTIGFENLLDHYEAATRLVNSFGSNKAREIEAKTFEESFEHESTHLKEMYTTAVEIGCDGEPLEELVSLAESLAVADCFELYAFDGEKDEENRDLDTAEHVRRATCLAEGVSVEGYEAHVAAIRNESALSDPEAGRYTTRGVEAQD